MTSYPSHQFAAFRILFGCYLTWLFAGILPFSSELFGHAAIPHVPSNYRFPDMLSLGNGIVPINAFLVVLVILAVLFTLGAGRRVVAVLIWYGLACLLHQNDDISGVHLPYVGWMLLASAIIPEGEPLRLWPGSSDDKWSMPSSVFLGAWIVTAAAYSISGYYKLGGREWLDGTLMSHMLTFPAIRDWWLTRAMGSMPQMVGRLLTWSVLGFELFCVPLCLFRITRAVTWLFLTVTQVALLAL